MNTDLLYIIGVLILNSMRYHCKISKIIKNNFYIIDIYHIYIKLFLILQYQLRFNTKHYPLFLFLFCVSQTM